jgi:hypothetical protein
MIFINFVGFGRCSNHWRPRLEINKRLNSFTTNVGFVGYCNDEEFPEQKLRLVVEILQSKQKIV